MALFKNGRVLRNRGDSLEFGSGRSLSGLEPSDFEQVARKLIAKHFGKTFEGKPFEIQAHKIHKGRSGQKYEIDLSFTVDLSGVTILVFVECKCYKRPVGVDDVLEFVAKLEDVSAHKGILISTVGFSSGAIKVAKSKRVALLIAHAAERAELDIWIGSDDWGNVGYRPGLFSIYDLRMQEQNGDYAIRVSPLMDAYLRVFPLGSKEAEELEDFEILFSPASREIQKPQSGDARLKSEADARSMTMASDRADELRQAGKTEDAIELYISISERIERLWTANQPLSEVERNSLLHTQARVTFFAGLEIMNEAGVDQRMRPWDHIPPPNERLHRALALLQQAEKIDRSLASLSGPDQECWHIYIELGHLYHRLKNKQASFASYSKSLEGDPTARQRSLSYGNRGFLQLYSGDYAEAAEDFQRAEAEGFDPPGVSSYNAACAYALAKQTNKAIQMLRQAESKGYPGKTKALDDDDFTHIRESKDFIDFIDE